MQKMKMIMKNTFDFLCDALIYFVFLWAGVLAISFTCGFPKIGLKVLVFSILMVIIPKIVKRLKKNKEESNGKSNS